MTFERLIADVVGRLDDVDIPHMLTGSIASSWYGEPRATQDLDVVIDPSPEAFERLVDGLLTNHWYVDRDVAHAAVRDRTKFNAIGPDAVKVDFIIRHDRPFSVTEFHRRRAAELLGTRTSLPTVEDMVLVKLEWAQTTDSDRQIRDVIGMLAVAGDGIDLAYIDGWVRRLGLERSCSGSGDDLSPPRSRGSASGSAAISPAGILLAEVPVPDPAIRALFDPSPGRTYLDAATYGLPPRPAVEAMERALRAWQTGTARWVDDWDRPVEAVRGDFASIIGATAGEVALVPAASVAAGLVAEGLQPGDVVVVPEDDHVSDLFPLLVAERRGVEVRQVPFAEVVPSIDDRTTLIAGSLVQMQTGRIGDLDGICRRARAVGAKVFVDATHALPFVPVAPHIADIDFLVCHAYKHMLGARGTGFLYVRSDRVDELMPSYANWHGAPDRWTRFFGGPLTLADDASRFDVSLAWLPWTATLESTRLIAGWCRDGTLAEPLELAARLARSLGQEPTGSSLVCVPIADPEPVRAALEAAGIRAAVRGDAIRFSLHVWNDDADVDRAVEAIRPLM